MGWLNRIRWARAAQFAGIGLGVVAAAATLVALGDSPPPRLADDIGLQMTAPAPDPPPEPASGRLHGREAGMLLARATADGVARARHTMKAVRPASRPSPRPKAGRQPPGPEPEPAPTPAAPPPPPPQPAAPVPPPPAPAPAAVPAVAAPPQPPPSPADDGEFGFEN